MTKNTVRWIEIVAGIAGLVGTVGLISLMIEGSWAADPRGGFEGGNGRTFNNPNAFAGAGTPPRNNNFFDEDDEADEDFDPPGGRSGNMANPSGLGNSGAAYSAGGDSSSQGGTPIRPGPNGSVSLGGGSPGGTISNNKTPALPVDSETAEGSKETVVDFNFPDADIMDIAKTLGKLTGKNFILDKDVKGRITIISNAPITVGDAWKAFLTSLDINGFALIPSGKYLRIARQRDARDKQLKTYTGDYTPDTDALITKVFPLKYLSSEEVARNFRSFMPANSRIIPYEQTNTVIVTDTGSNIAKLGKLLDILDVEGYDAGIEVIPVKFASAVELSKLIDTLVPGTSAGGAPGAPRFGGGSGGRFSARRTKEGGIINTIIADERTNTLIVHANTRGADQIRELVAKLDQRLPSTQGGGKVHVVYLQFADAEQLGNTLNNFSSQTAGARPTTPGGGTGVNPVASSLFEGSIKVSPDKATNSLVITASPADFVTVQRVINKLDIPRDQVYAEVVIMEISLGRDFQFSTNIINPTNGIGFTPNSDLFDFIANPLSAKGAILGFKSGAPQDLTIGGNKVTVSNVQGLVRALQTRSNGNILATPQILALDNTEASFETTEKIPYPTSTAVQGAGVSTSIQKENVSLSITIKPQINKVANFVKMDIVAKLADIDNRELPAQVKDLAFATFERNAKTSIVCADQDTVVLGGLVRDNSSEQVSKVPILGDIPLLGWLFKARKTQSNKTNLLIFITPHIVRQYDAVRAILDKKLKERDDFLETSTGGEDPTRKYRDNLIRNLPDMKEIMAKKPQRYVNIDEPGPGEEDSKVPAHAEPNTPSAAPATGAPGAGGGAGNSMVQPNGFNGAMPPAYNGGAINPGADYIPMTPPPYIPPSTNEGGLSYP